MHVFCVISQNSHQKPTIKSDEESFIRIPILE